MTEEISERTRGKIYRVIKKYIIDSRSDFSSDNFNGSIENIYEDIYYDFIPDDNNEDFPPLHIGRELDDEWFYSFLETILNDSTPKGYVRIRDFLDFFIKNKNSPGNLKRILIPIIEEASTKGAWYESDDKKPIILGHNNPPVDDAIKAIEEAIPEIENYRPNEEKNINEKNTILSSVKLGLQALKDGAISSRQLINVREAFIRARNIIVESGKLAKALQAIGALMKFLGLI